MAEEFTKRRTNASLLLDLSLWLRLLRNMAENPQRSPASAEYVLISSFVISYFPSGQFAF